MIRQYIGARYTIKVYENSQDESSAEWEANTAYEPLTLVIYNYNSYLSKKEVPNTVGDPANNPEYWVQTGYYNGQISNLQEQINEMKFAKTPQMYGAYGDGTHDDTQALQDAIDDSENNMLIIPEGEYLITSPLIIKRAIVIIGTAGPARTYRTIDGYVSPISFIKVGAAMTGAIEIQSDNVTIKYLGINCEGVSTYGLYNDDHKYYSRLNLECVNIEDAVNDCFHLTTYVSTIKLCVAHKAGANGFFFGSGAGAGMTGLILESCYSDRTVTGFYIKHYEYSNLISCAVDNSTNGYIIENSNTVGMSNCGTELVNNPITLSGTKDCEIHGFVCYDIDEAYNTNGAVIKCDSFTYNLVLSGINCVSQGTPPYEGYMLSFPSSDRVGNISILDDSIKYAQIYLNEAVKPQKFPISFPYPVRSSLNGNMTLNTSTIDQCSCKKLHDGEYLITVDTVDASAPRVVFPLCTLNLKAGDYVVKGMEESSSSTSATIGVYSNGYGSGVIASDSGEWKYFTLANDSTVYVSLNMVPNASRTKRYIPEIIKLL